LSVSTFAVESSHRILERNTPLDPTGRTFVESKTYYLDGNWALGSEGRIYAPLDRDAYEISVLDQTGELLAVFGRQVTPRKRTQDEKDEVGPVINAAGRADRSGWKIADHDQAVLRILFNHEENTVWVLTPQGSNDQPAGILETWDVFGTDGTFLRQVAVPLANEMDDGTCYLVGGGLLVVVKGTASSFDGRPGAADETTDDEVEPLEVICFRMR
jgi:hypothetical protein